MFKIKKQNLKSNLFRFPAEAVKIVDFTSSGHYIIEVSVAIDAYSAIAQNVSGVHISMYAMSPSAITNESVVTDVTSSPASKVFEYNNDKKNQSIKAYNSFIDRQIIDIRGGVDDAVDLTRGNKRGEIVSLSLGTKNAQGIVQNVRPERRILQAFDISKAPTSSGDTVGIITPIVHPPANRRANGSTLRENAMRLIYELAVDPAATARFPFPIQTANQASSGLISNDILDAGTKCSTCTSRMRRRDKSIKKSTLYKNEAATNVGELQKDVYADRFLKNYTTMYKRSLTESADSSNRTILIRKLKGKFKIFKAHLKIDWKLHLSGGKLSFLFEALDTRENVIGYKYNHTSFVELKQAFEHPIVAPSISATWHEPGTNILTISQNDPYASEISVYRKLVSLRNSNYDVQGGYTLVETVPVSQLDGDVYISDRLIQNYGATIYRAVSRSKGGRVSYNFDSAVVVTPASLNNLSFSFDTFFASGYITCHNEYSGVMVKINGIDANYSSFYVVAQDITGISNPRFAAFSERVLGLKSFLVSEGGATLEILDRQAIRGKKYRYRLIFLDHCGIKHDSTISYIHEYQFVEKPQAKLKITDVASSVVGPGKFRVSFSPSATFLKKGFEDVLSTLRSAGATDSFIDDIKSNREQFSSILKVRVERHDLFTGDVVDLGFHDPGTPFADSPSSAEDIGAPLLDPGRVYRYDVSLYRQSPMSLFPNLKQEIVDGETLKPFMRDNYKFLSRPMLQAGILPAKSAHSKLSTSEFPEFADVKDTSELFLEGDLHIKKSFKISTPTSSAQIIDLVMLPRADGRVALSWNVMGDMGDIDHFIIFCKYAGIKAPVGVAHTFAGLDITFVDNNLAGVIGDRLYTVLPVYKDFSFGDESEGLSFTKDHNLDNVEMIAS